MQIPKIFIENIVRIIYTMYIRDLQDAARCYSTHGVLGIRPNLLRVPQKGLLPGGGNLSVQGDPGHDAEAFKVVKSRQKVNPYLYGSASIRLNPLDT